MKNNASEQHCIYATRWFCIRQLFSAIPTFRPCTPSESWPYATCCSLVASAGREAYIRDYLPSGLDPPDCLQLRSDISDYGLYCIEKT